MGGAGFPPCWFLAWGNPALESMQLFGGANGRLWDGSSQGILPRTSAVSVLVSVVSHSQPPPLQETLQH